MDKQKSKKCTKCTRLLDLDKFSKRKNGKFGRGTVCRECDSNRMRIYASNPTIREKRRQRSENWYKENRDKASINRTNHRLQNRAKYLLNFAKKRAFRKGIEFSLTLEDIKIIQKRIEHGICEITGIAFDHSHGRNFNSPSIDRIDSSQGYIISNIRIICYAMNVAMNDWGEEAIWKMFQAWQENKGKKCYHQ